VSVTAVTACSSRNATGCLLCDGRVEFVPIPDSIGGTYLVDGTRKAYWTEFYGVRGTHCTTCHSRHHNACEACGECMFDQRADARYCSGACRQRAYRERRAA
jgi:hypothetical protein